MVTQLPGTATKPRHDTSLTILLVDDDKDSRDCLKLLLSSAGHRIIEARNGQEAIDLYRTKKVDIIFMDIIMPIIDGYEATKKIKSIDTQNHVPILFITSLTDNESLIKCIEAGGDDFLTKPYNAILLQAKLDAHTRIINLTQGLKKQNDLLCYFRNNIEREHQIAKNVFNRRLALGQIASPYVEYHFSSMAIFNGDIYQCITTLTGEIYILLGDFTGHGLTAATGTLPVSDTFTTLAQNNQPVAAIATAINSLLDEILPDDMFCAAAILRLDPRNLRVEIWFGGLPDMFLVHHKKKIITTILSQHMPLGILSQETFDDSTQFLDLSLDDSLYIYTDGIIETMNDDDETFGEERLKSALLEHSNSSKVLEKILETTIRFSHSETQRDDISIIRVSAPQVDS